MKVAFTGSSGSGKTTLVCWVSEEFGLKHISGSAGDVLKQEDKDYLKSAYGYPGDLGHPGVIVKSANDVEYGYKNQVLLQKRRAEIISNNFNFVIDRSPLDNLTYMINQVGFHHSITDPIVKQFAENCLRAWNMLTHVIFVRACQPYSEGIENNKSRVSNWWYQKSIDAQFSNWLYEWFIRENSNRGIKGPEILVISFWDLEKRKIAIKQFLNS